MEKIFDDWKLLTFIAKGFSLDFWQNLEYVFAVFKAADQIRVI